MITPAQLISISPNVQKLDIYLQPLNNGMRDFEINTAPRTRYYISHLFHESSCFKYMQEIADGSAYEGRKDLGNTQPGDGKKYKGRGPMQITGRITYHLCGLALGLDLISKPELLELPEHAFRASAWFWSGYKKLNQYADKPEDWFVIYKNKTYKKFEWITYLINGGENGLEERRAYYNRSLLAIK